MKNKKGGTEMKASRADISKSCRKKWMYIRQHPGMYVMLLPGLFFLFIYKLFPLYGIQIAFRDYNVFLGNNPIDAIAKSPWVGLKYFEQLFSSAQFLKGLGNTLTISVLKIIFLFPLPIICAILLNEIHHKLYHKLVQTVIYVPYFLSWVIIYGVFYSIVSSYGVLNSMLGLAGSDKINLLSDPVKFIGLLVFTEGWKETGYNTIIYLASITAIDGTLFEAARMDGANRWKQIWHVTLPGLLPTIVLMLILRVGNILNAGFEQILVFYNSSVYSTADIIDTYVYRMGLGQMDFSLSSAMSLFNSVVAFILIVGANAVSRKLTERSIW